MSSKTKREPDALDRAAVTARWQEALLDLFWTVDEAIRTNEASGLPVTIFDAYSRADEVRGQL